MVEARPHWRQRKTKAAVFIFACAVACFVWWVVHDGLHGKKTWSSDALMALSTAFMTVAFYEISNVVFQYALWRRAASRFDEFFGDDASDRSQDGQVRLQVDKISDLVEPFVRDFEKLIDDRPHSRLYKARYWVNRYDALAARALNHFFRDLSLPAPQTISGDREPRDVESPFLIYMGLTAETNTLVTRVGKDWLRCNAGQGEFVELIAKLVPDEMRRLKAEGDGPFRELRPKDWDLEEWSKRQSDDYAIILRHTDLLDGRRQVSFVVAGYTEVGTAAASEYLTHHWEQLWESHVRGNVRDQGLGDFLVVISGPSRESGFSEWRREREFTPITPRRLFDIAKHMETPWVDRFRGTEVDQESRSPRGVKPRRWRPA